MDFELALFLALLLAGLIMYWDRVIGRPRRTRQAGSDATLRMPLIVEYSRAFFPVILAVFLLRAFIVEPFRIPSGSMLPSLFIGDFILVSKSSYGIKLPILKHQIVPMGNPERGDVMVFRFPKDPKTNFIKRVIGTPGDVVSYHNKRLSINGEPLPLETVELLDWPTEAQDGRVKTFLEQIDTDTHTILIDTRSASRSMRVKVPQGHYFVMGDNRDHSNDSRYWGFVPEEFVVGKAFFIWFSWDSAGGGGVNWGRIGNLID
ncbi:MAG TPA: signal peptidase I [Gammaproteobacteria bacterium]|jgi:signal peptidase I|nr:signal peptidase I [Acidiferrobacteraceae bacterium]HCX86549.1 signal peptidase I [Gammaproteobacteria bacterium]|tara:strand:+ start:64408 stop:65190 length:783 start_codon:yes stop_codon:yes gene_type:complete